MPPTRCRTPSSGLEDRTTKGSPSGTSSNSATSSSSSGLLRHLEPGATGAAPLQGVHPGGDMGRRRRHVTTTPGSTGARTAAPWRAKPPWHPATVGSAAKIVIEVEDEGGHRTFGSPPAPLPAAPQRVPSPHGRTKEIRGGPFPTIPTPRRGVPDAADVGGGGTVHSQSAGPGLAAVCRLPSAVSDQSTTMISCCL